VEIESLIAIHIYRIVDDKIVEHKAIRDDLSLMVQLGVLNQISMNLCSRHGKLGKDYRQGIMDHELT